MSIKLASWNVNSIAVRLSQVLQWLDDSDCDILALQETKVIDEKFPKQAFEEAGFNVVFAGQRTYNGMAIVSKKPITDITTDIEEIEDVQRRILIASIDDLRLINLYVPNGSEVGSDKYDYKLRWLDAITKRIKFELIHHKKVAVVGDFNIAPTDEDVSEPESWGESVLLCDDVRKAFQRIEQLGLKDSFRKYSQSEGSYSWWDYRAACFRRNRGMRIDHILLSAELFESCKASGIDVSPRRLERPSDHTPVWAVVD